MRIYGVDFTSAPRPRKPIRCGVCTLDAGLLRLVTVRELADFAAFAAWLRAPGPWLAGFDFPFGQPRKLIDNLGWPPDWAGYVGGLAQTSMAEFAALLAAYRAERPAGDKQHLRVTDALAGARSPMMLYGVPVGRMFLRGAPRLLAAGVSVLPCHPTAATRLAIETYPALAARRWIGRAGYKSDTRRKQTAAHAEARRAIVAGLLSDALPAQYGVTLALTDEQAAQLVADPSGDTLDAVLCAVQAAWAYTQRAAGYGIPPDVDAAEGWIVDPLLWSGGAD